MLPSVHPRVCGELMLNPGTFAASDGSSPRVWGTLSKYSGEISWGRFIPACVGNSWSLVAKTVSPSVHPRVCGELVPILEIEEPTRGSSPRVWGTRCIALGVAFYPRFIPACVGNSAQTKDGSDLPPVHPRVCGELCNVSATRCLMAGSSPRVWGTLHYLG